MSSNCTLENSSMMVYPNPTADNFTVLIQTSATFENATLELIDNMGRVVSSKTLDIQAGSTIIPFESRDLQAGVYVIRMRVYSAAGLQILYNQRSLGILHPQ